MKVKRAWKRISKDEGGQVMVIALIMLTIGALMVPPLLDFATSSVDAIDLYQDEASSIYAADAGMQHAAWVTLNTSLGSSSVLKALNPMNPDYDPYDYSTVWTYDLANVGSAAGGGELNGMEVRVGIQNAWVPEVDFRQFGDIDPRGIVFERVLTIRGAALSGTSPVVSGSSVGTYAVTVTYNVPIWHALLGLAGEWEVEKIGVWMPEGYSYVDGSCSLAEDAMYDDNISHLDKVDAHPYGGGSHQVVFSFLNDMMVPGPIKFDRFASVNPGTLGYAQGQSHSIYFSFDFKRLAGTQPPECVSWIDTAKADTNTEVFQNPIPYSWDPRARLYRIVATSEGYEGPQNTVESVLTINSPTTYWNLFDNAVTTPGTLTIRANSTVSGTVTTGNLEITGSGTQTGGDQLDFNEFDIDFPTAGEMVVYYLNQVTLPGSPGGAYNLGDPLYPEILAGTPAINLIGQDDVKVIGPQYFGGSIKLRRGSNENPFDGVGRLGGTVFVNGDFEIQDDPVFDLNGQTIFATGGITCRNEVMFIGSGCLVAIGDVDFKAKGGTGNPDDFVFVMSLSGSVTFHAKNEIYGSVAAAGGVEVKAKVDLTHTDWSHLVLNFPYLEDPTTLHDFIDMHTWKID